MKIKFLGATKCITGSCHLLDLDNTKILLDCGLFQGKDAYKYENDKFFFNPKEIDYVILSHCHVDHSGRIPLLYKHGFRGRVICTKPTVDLCDYLLRDTAKIFEEENINLKSHNKEASNCSLYEEGDVEEVLKLFEGYDYAEKIKLNEEICVEFKDAGHVLGSAICEILIKKSEGKIFKLVYSGDIGNVNKDILNDPQYGIDADYLIIESTYGSKLHKHENNYPKLLKIAEKTMEKGGNVIIPCFSLGRTQELVYMLNRFIEAGRLLNCQVYVDSPLASAITNIFKKYEDYFDKEAQRLIARGDDPLEFRGLHFVDKEYKTIDHVKSGAIIIVAGGIHQGGRITNQLMNNIERRECSIIITSYNGRKSLGSKLLNGYKEVDILGETMKVRASIHYMGGLSLHADKKGLLEWVNRLKKRPKKIFIVHGEGKNIETFTRELTHRNYNASMVEFQQEIEVEDN